MVDLTRIELATSSAATALPSRLRRLSLILLVLKFKTPRFRVGFSNFGPDKDRTCDLAPLGGESRLPVSHISNKKPARGGLLL